MCIAFLALCFRLHGAGLAVGMVAPEWSVTNWLNSAPLRLADLRGKVVLARWWTAPDCRYCAATAPALNEFHKRYADEGLAVVAFYHHKSADPLDGREVARHAKRFGFKFPVAIDLDWRTLQEWWLKDRDRDWTSVTFLLDSKGVVRHIHPGGQFVKGDRSYRELEEKIKALLAERNVQRRSERPLRRAR
ncbi:MAG: redoxin domain-containing protein [Verrucomicrobia subdivision 3 bacterium]|nr:redoxin domain-containing protein [Limisphaerales bacterium]